MKKTPITIKIPENIDNIIDELSENTGLNKQDIVNEALRHAPNIELSDKITRCYSIDESMNNKIIKRTGKNKSTYYVFAILTYLIKKKLL